MFFMCIYDPTIGGCGTKHDEYKLLVPRHQQYRADGVVYPMTIFGYDAHHGVSSQFAPFWRVLRRTVQ